MFNFLYNFSRPFFSNSLSISNLIDLSITPNRPDCLGIRGIARDLAASGFGKLIELKEKKISPEDAYDKGIVKDRFTSFLKKPPEFI